VEALGVRLFERDLRGANFLIFVTVGNATQGFDRILEAVEKVREEGGFKEDVVVQYGHSNFIPRGCRSRSFFTREEFLKLIMDASLVITHGGAGTIGLCLKAGKKPLVVPRVKVFGEHVNDHQIELARELESQGRIYAVYDVCLLSNAVQTAMWSRAVQPVPEGSGN
jgi:UDP-N-acetylglucosamine transferase subunit ALG13